VCHQRGGVKKIPGLELKHITTDFWVFTVKKGLRLGVTLSLLAWSVARCDE
jgi:hypothetical protein